MRESFEVIRQSFLSRRQTRQKMHFLFQLPTEIVKSPRINVGRLATAHTAALDVPPAHRRRFLRLHAPRPLANFPSDAILRPTPRHDLSDNARELSGFRCEVVLLIGGE